MKKNSKLSKATLRRQAEARLSESKEKAGAEIQPMNEAEFLRLVHELQVHQIELEMQNEELLRSQTEAEESYRQYTDLYDFAPMGYLKLASDGAILNVNMAGANLLGMAQGELINRRLGLFVSIESRSTFSDFLEILISGEGKKICELMLFKGEARPLWVRIEATCFEGGKESRAVMVDITERKQAQEVLQNFKNLLAETEKIGKVGGWEFNMDTKEQRWTEEVYRIHELEFSYKPTVDKGINFYAPSSRPIIEQAVQRAIEYGEPFDEELEIITAKGNHRWVHAIGKAELEQRRVFGFFQDITKRKQAEVILQARLRLSQFADSHSLDELLQKALDEAEALTGSQIGFFHFLEEDQNTLLLQMWSTNTIQNMCAAEGKGQHYSIDQAGAWVDCVYSRSPVIHNDYASLTHRKSLPDGHAPVHRILVVPVIRENLIMMIVGVGNKANNYDELDVRAVSDLADSAWDIVQRKRAEEALRESEKQLKETQFIAGLGSYSFYFSAGKWESSDVLDTIFGIDKTFERSIEGWAALIHPADRQYMTDYIMNKVIGKHVRFDKEYRIVRNNDGIERWVHGQGKLEFDSQGQIVRMIGTIQDITERKQAEAKLIESEFHLRNIINNEPECIKIVDAQGHLIEMNPAGLAMIEADSLAQVAGRRVLEMIAPEYRKAFAELHKRVLAGEAMQMEFEMLGLRGGRRWLETHAVPMQLHGETVLLSITRDITERKQVQDALRESQELFSLFMQYSPVYTFIKSVTPTESRVIQASENYQEMIGIPGREMVGRTMEELFPPELAAKFTADDWSVVAKGEVLKLNEDMNGRHYTTIRFPIARGEKTLLGGYTIDITEQVQAQEDLRLSEEKYRTVANFTYDWETWRGPDGNYLYVSPSCERVTGHKAEEFLADPNLVVKITHPDDQQMVNEHYGNASDGSKAQDLHLDYRIITPDGKMRWIGHYCTAVYGEHGQWMGRRESNRDITERVWAEQALKTANSQLQIAFARQQQLAHTDELTGINNRRYLYELTEHEFDIAVRYQQPLSVIMFDIDYFKGVNDTFGHAVGDHLLKRVTEAACAELRSVDVIGRYGGEEFVIVLPMTNAQQAYPLAERIRSGVAAMSVSTEKGDAIVTLSIGIVEMLPGSQIGSAEKLIREADKAMYSAKQAGRNRTEIGK